MLARITLLTGVGYMAWRLARAAAATEPAAAAAGGGLPASGRSAAQPAEGPRFDTDSRSDRGGSVPEGK